MLIRECENMVRKIGFTVIPDRVNDPCFGSGGFLAGFRVLGSNLTGFLDAGLGIQVFLIIPENSGQIIQ